MFVTVWVKDYTIELDGKPYTVKGDRWFGVIDKNNPEKYFCGGVFDFNEKTGTYTYGGSVSRTETEFYAEAEKYVFIK